METIIECCLSDPHAFYFMSFVKAFAIFTGNNFFYIAILAQKIYIHHNSNTVYFWIWFSELWFSTRLTIFTWKTCMIISIETIDCNGLLMEWNVLDDRRCKSRRCCLARAVPEVRLTVPAIGVHTITIILLGALAAPPQHWYYRSLSYRNNTTHYTIQLK